MVGKKYIVQCPAQKSIEQTKKKTLESEREKERDSNSRAYLYVGMRQ